MREAGGISHAQQQTQAWLSCAGATEQWDQSTCARDLICTGLG